MPVATQSDVRVSERYRWITSPKSQGVAFGLLFAVLVIVMQYRSGAYWSDLASDPDEPSHAVSSLMVRDYLAQGLPHNPLTFARAFYVHYPKVAIGHWPPLFYCGEGLWMLVAGRSRVAMLLFVALCGAALVWSVFWTVRSRCSLMAALVSVAALMGTEIFRQMVCAVRPDLLLGLLVFWAAVFCGEYMESGARRSRNLFLLFAAGALLVHGRGVVVLLLPFCLLPLRRKFVGWKWPVAGVLAFGVMVLPRIFGTLQPFSVASTLRDGETYLLHLGIQLGWAMSALAVVGLAVLFRQASERKFWAAMAGLAVCGLVFFLFLPVYWEDRWLMSIVAAVAVLAGLGAEAMLSAMVQFQPKLRWVLRACGVLGAAGLMLIPVARVETKLDLGYRSAVANCLVCRDEVTLVAADAYNEGALIVEASLADRGRKRTVMRGTRALATSTWSGDQYRVLYASPEDLRRFLDETRVSLVLVQAEGGKPHVALLRAAVSQDPEDWVPDKTAVGLRGIDVYRRAR